MNHLRRVATVLGAAGVLVCLSAAAGRFIGEREFIQFQAINIFNVGVGLMVMACWLKLEASE